MVVVDDTKAYNLPVEYNWRPPQCKHCEVFGHTDDKCGKVLKNNRTTSVWLRTKGSREYRDTITIQEPVVKNCGEVEDIVSGSLEGDQQRHEENLTLRRTRRPP